MTTINYVPLKPKAGSGEGWKVAFTTNAMCLYEEQFGGDFSDITAHFQKTDGGRINATVMRKILWCALQEYQEGITLKEAGAVLDECGMAAAWLAAAGAVRLAFPDANDAAGNGVAAEEAAVTTAKAAPAGKS